jgi:hypothetical protein
MTTFTTEDRENSMRDIASIVANHCRLMRSTIVRILSRYPLLALFLQKMKTIATSCVAWLTIWNPVLT